MARWEVEGTDHFIEWFETLDLEERRGLRCHGGRGKEGAESWPSPCRYTLKGSRRANMKELRPPTGNIRILFAFDPRRTAILLIGGDKTDRWQAWYARMIPVADDLDDRDLEELTAEGLLP